MLTLAEAQSISKCAAHDLPALVVTSEWLFQHALFSGHKWPNYKKVASSSVDVVYKAFSAWGVHVNNTQCRLGTHTHTLDSARQTMHVQTISLAGRNHCTDTGSNSTTSCCLRVGTLRTANESSWNLSNKQVLYKRSNKYGMGRHVYRCTVSNYLYCFFYGHWSMTKLSKHKPQESSIYVSTKNVSPKRQKHRLKFGHDIAH